MNKKTLGLLGSAATIAGLLYSLYKEVEKINFDELDFNYEGEPYVSGNSEEDSDNQQDS